MDNYLTESNCYVKSLNYNIYSNSALLFKTNIICLTSWNFFKPGIPHSFKLF